MVEIGHEEEHFSLLGVGNFLDARSMKAKRSECIDKLLGIGSGVRLSQCQRVVDAFRVDIALDEVGNDYRAPQVLIEIDQSDVFS